LKEHANESPIVGNEKVCAGESDRSTAARNLVEFLVGFSILFFFGSLLPEPAILSLIIALALFLFISAAAHAIWGLLSKKSRPNSLGVALLRAFYGLELSAVAFLFRSSVETMGPLGLCCLLAGCYIQSRGISEFLVSRKEKKLRGGKDVFVGLAVMVLALVLKR